MCLFNPRKGTSKVNLRSFREHFRSKSPNFQAVKEGNIWKLRKFECFWIYIYISAEDDDMGILWGMIFTSVKIYYVSCLLSRLMFPLEIFYALFVLIAIV